MEILTLFLPMKLAILLSRMSLFVVLGVSGEKFILTVFCRARNSCKQTVDPDQTPHLVASELGDPHCLHTHCVLKRALTLYKAFYPLTTPR